MKSRYRLKGLKNEKKCKSDIEDRMDPVQLCNKPLPDIQSRKDYVSILTELTLISIDFLTLKHAEFDESNANVLERFYTSAGNPVKEILLKLNLPDHSIKVKEFQRSFRHSDTERLSRSDEVLKLKNFKKDATLKLFKSTNQESPVVKRPPFANDPVDLVVYSSVVAGGTPYTNLLLSNAFLNGCLSETVSMHQPPGFVDNQYPHHGSQVAYLLIYVDDIILTASCPALLQHIIGLFLSQKKYAIQLLERAHMVTCNPSRTPVDTESKLGLEDAPVQDPTLYCSLAGGSKPHLAALKRILRYVQGTLDLGLHLYASSTTSLVGYTDADWAGCPSTRRSTSVIVSFWVITYYLGPLNDNTLYVVAETTWLRNLLRELHSPLSTVTLVYCDNVSAVYMYANPVQHQRTKHIEIDIHFVRDMVTVGQVRVLHVPSRF
ncbi:ribonuclease H-like domain-containing protein [Tanacetum coccineum]